MSHRSSRALAMLSAAVLALAAPCANAQDLMDHVQMDSPEMTEAEMTREELLALIAAGKGGRIDLTRRRLSGLDLNGVDFQGADLRWARMNGTRLRGARLAGADLASAWLIGADLEDADLSGASLFSTQMQKSSLRNARLAGARIVANLQGADLAGADLRDADMAADMRNQSMGLMRVILRSANLDDTDLRGARAGKADAEFASLRNARLEGADFTDARLAGADLTGASVAGLVLSGADLDSAMLVSLRGRDDIVGLDSARNLEAALSSGPAGAAADPAALAQQLIAEVKAQVPTIDTPALKGLIDAQASFVLLDVRMPEEIRSAGRIDAPQQVEIPRGWLEIRIFEQVLDKSTPIVVYCGTGVRSAFATRTLRQMGFGDVRNYEEGFITWRLEGHSVAR